MVQQCLENQFIKLFILFSTILSEMFALLLLKLHWAQRIQRGENISPFLLLYYYKSLYLCYTLIFLNNI